MKRIARLIVVLQVCVVASHAQRDVQFTQVDKALGYYNPAVAGLSGQLDVAALYRLQWVGWTNAPKTIFATANMPITFMKKTHGIGATVVSDQESSLYGSLSAGLQYAFLKKIGRGTLRVGIQAGMYSLTAGGGQITTPVDSLGNSGGSGEGANNGAVSDPAIPTAKVTARTFDAHLGLYYATDRWYIGMAVMHILEPTVDDEKLYTYVERGYNLVGGYNIRTNNPLIEVLPSVFVKTNFNMYQVDVTVRAAYAKLYSAGLMWRKGESIALLLGARLGKIEGGYAYDIPVFSAIRKGTIGSHELFLKYKIPVNKPKTGKSKHKSVRIL